MYLSNGVTQVLRIRIDSLVVQTLVYGICDRGGWALRQRSFERDIVAKFAGILHILSAVQIFSLSKQETMQCA